MDKKNKNIQEMRKMGFSQKTLSLLNESQIDVLLEKIKRKETKEAETTTTTVKKVGAKEPLNMTPEELSKAQKDKTATTLPDGSMEFKTTKKETKEAVTPIAEPAKTKFKVDKAGGNLPPNPTGKGYNVTSNPDGTMIVTPMEESKKKKKKYNPWAVCTASVGRKNKKKYEDCVMGVKEKIKEGRNPYEYLIESKMEEIVSEHLSPKMTKGELMNIISEKKMMMKPIGKMMSMKGETMEGETKTKEKEKVTTQPKTKPTHPGKRPSEAPHPAKAMMKGETMEGETETETAPVRTTPAEPKTRPSHPGRKPNPDTEHAPAKAEKKKEEIINAIAKLIGKGK